MVQGRCAERLNFSPGSIQNGVQDGRRNMANWLISRNRSILGAINVLSAYGKQPKSYRKNILARSCTVSIQDGVQDGRRNMANC